MIQPRTTVSSEGRRESGPVGKRIWDARSHRARFDPPNPGSRLDVTQPIPPRPDAPDGGDAKGLPGPTWRPIEAVPLFLIALFTTALLTVPISLLGSCSARYDLAVLVGEVALGGSVLWWVAWIKRTSLRALGMPRRPGGDLVAGLVAGLVLVVVAAVILTVVQAVAKEILGHAPKEPQQVVGCVRGTALSLLGPIVIIAAPLGEELFFRGFLYQGLRRRFSVWTAAVFSGIFFGLVHFGGVAFLLIVPSLTAVGIGLALVFERRRSLLASMAAHAVFNVVGYVAIVLSR
jgi:CAAX protease family protein